jgi:hypothetical protein
MNFITYLKCTTFYKTYCISSAQLYLFLTHNNTVYYSLIYFKIYGNIQPKYLNYNIQH